MVNDQKNDWWCESKYVVSHFEVGTQNSAPILAYFHPQHLNSAAGGCLNNTKYMTIHAFFAFVFGKASTRGFQQERPVLCRSNDRRSCCCGGVETLQKRLGLRGGGGDVYLLRMRHPNCGNNNKITSIHHHNVIIVCVSRSWPKIKKKRYLPLHSTHITLATTANSLSRQITHVFV